MKRIGLLAAFVVGATLGVLVMSTVDGAARTDLAVPAVALGPGDAEEVSDRDVEVVEAGDAGAVLLAPGTIDFAAPPRLAAGWTAAVDSRKGPWRRAVTFTSPGREIGVIGFQESRGRVIDVCEATSPPDGRLRVGDAGHLAARADGFRLELGEPEPAEGWSILVEERDVDEIESIWSRGSESFRVEIEAENGALDVEVCERRDGGPHTH